MLGKQLETLRSRLGEWWSRHDQNTRELPHYLGKALTNYNRYASRSAAALAYYAIFSVFPLSLLVAVLISRILGPTIAQEQVTVGLSAFLPELTVTEIQKNVAQTLEQGSQFGAIAIAGLAWAATALFNNITTALDRIFQVPSYRSLWRQRLLSVGMAMALMILLTSSFLTSGVLRLVSALLLDRPSIWISIGSFFLPSGLNMVIFALLFRYVPARRVSWDAIWPSAIFGAVGWEVVKAGFSWYLANIANYQFVYGSIFLAIVFLFWAYLMASIFLLSAELCAQLNDWFIAQDERENARLLLDAGYISPVLPPVTSDSSLPSTSTREVEHPLKV